MTDSDRLFDAGPGPAVTDTVTLTDADRVQGVLDALCDAECRTMLRETVGRHRTAQELAEQCDIPESTVYRKIDTLATAGLLEQTTWVRRSGAHTAMYACAVQTVTVAVGDRGVTVELERRAEDQSDTAPQGAVGD